MAKITLQGAITPGRMILQPGEKTVYKRSGIIERTSVYMSYGEPDSPPVPLYTPYPDQSTGGFVCDQTIVEAATGGFYRTTVVWVSIVSDGSSYTTFETKTIQVPVEQSANFFDLAGTPSSPKPGAIFDGNGRFVGFVSPSPYVGVVSVFQSQRTMIIRGSSSSVVNVSTVNQGFLESMSTTVRGKVVEYEIVYNLSININGIPGVSTS